MATNDVLLSFTLEEKKTSGLFCVIFISYMVCLKIFNYALPEWIKWQSGDGSDESP